MISDILLGLAVLVLFAAAVLTIKVIGLVGVIFVLLVVGVALLVLALALVDGKGLPWRSRS